MSVLSKDNNDLALEALESIILLKNKVWVGTKYNLIWRLHVNTLLHNFKVVNESILVAIPDLCCIFSHPNLAI